MREIIAGSRVPNIELGFLDDHGEICSVAAPSVFAYGRALVLGIPGAFTPVCSKQHIPDFIQNADRLVAAGYSHLVCIAPNDPFVLAAWASALDPGRRIDFFSDGNLEFTRALRLETQSRALFLGRRSERYLMVVQDGIIVRLKVEEDILNYACTRPTELLDSQPP
jgi:peroxiredoxin